MDTSNPCPYLHVKDDPDTHAGYPSRLNHCHHASPHQPVAPLYQKDVCLTSAHQNCPIFKREGLWPGKLPNEIRTDEAYQAAIKKQAIIPTVDNQQASQSQPVPPIVPIQAVKVEPQAPAPVIPEPVTPEIEAAPAIPEPLVEEIEVAPALPEFSAEEIEAPPETIGASAAPIEPVRPKRKRVKPANQIESEPEALPEPVSDVEPVGSRIEAVSPLTVAAEVLSGERPKPPSPVPPRSASRIPRPLMLILGIIGALGVCVLLGAGAAMIARNLMSATPPATATETPTQTATLDEAGTATAGAVSITESPIPSTPTTAASTAVPISVQDTRMRFDGNLRSGPGTEYPLLGEVMAGTPVSVIGRDSLGVWLAIRLGSGQEGWIPASQVNTDGINVLSAPVLEAPAP